MIQARYETDGKRHSLSLMGHAHYDEYGKDIVCASVSSIVYALVGWLENNPDDLEDVSTSVESGEVLIECYGGEYAAVAFSMAAIGLEQLAYTYPDHVAIDILGL
jgi:uncharacterized protein YsxB (DUF464 family)